MSRIVQTDRGPEYVCDRGCTCLICRLESPDPNMLRDYDPCAWTTRGIGRRSRSANHEREAA